MGVKTRVLIVVMSGVLAVGGCQQPQHPVPGVTFEEHAITIDDLAARLGLRVEEQDETFVVLKDAANTVLIFTHADARFFINGKPAGTVGVVKRVGSTVYVPETLVTAIRLHLRLPGPQPPPVGARPRPKPATATVVVDAGHGGKDPGTMVAGSNEKYITLQVARKVAALLSQRGVNVVMTRDRDEFIELEERAEIANQRDTDLFVSIHADSAPDRSISGFTVYVSREASRDAYKAAQAVSATLSRTGSGTRGIREADYKVLVQTRCPAILVELGYLSNYTDSRRLQDNAFQTHLAQAIAAGVLNYVQ